MATHVNELLRLMVRAFHGPECGVVFDALLRANRCIKDDEMAASLKLQQKQVRKYLFQLKQDHIVTYENRNKEALNKGERSSAHLHWFVDYKNAVDCIKYRLHQISKRLNEEKDRELQVQMYECKQCRYKYSALDAAMLAIGGWRCDRCLGEVEEVEAAASASQTVNLAKTMWAQLKPITEAMKRVEAHPIPKFPKTAAGAVLAGMEDEGMLISTRSMSGGAVGGSGLGPAPSASSQSRANPAGGPVVNGGQVNVFVDIVGAQGGITGTTSGNQPPPKAPAKPAVPWLQGSSTTNTTSNAPTQTTTTNSNTANAPDEMDQATYEQYVKQYMEEYQKQVQSQQRATKQKANGGVKEEPNGADVAHAEKRKRVEEEEEEEEIKVEIQRDEIKQEPEPEPIIEFESEPSTAPAVEEPMVQIGDQQLPISHITDDHQAQMSEAEYEAYYKIYMDYYAEHQ